MLRSLKGRITLEVQEALAQVSRFGEHMDRAKEAIGKVQGAVQNLAAHASEAAKKTADEFRKIGPALESQMESIVKYRNWLMAIGAAAMFALGTFVKEAIKGERIMVLFNSLFAEGSEKAKQWAQALARSTGYGLSTVVHGMNLVQGYMLSFGMARDAASQASMRVVELASSISLLRGERFEDTIQTITRALAGQTRGLISLGIAINQSTLNETARAMGYRKSYNALTQVQRAEVALVAIEKAHGRSLGDLGDRVDLAAVAQNRLAESSRELKEAMGTAWLVPFKGVANAMASLFTAIANNRPLSAFLSIFVGIVGVLFSSLGLLGTFARHLINVKNLMKEFPAVRQAFEALLRPLKWATKLIWGKVQAWAAWVATRVKSRIALRVVEADEQLGSARSAAAQEVHNASMRVGILTKAKMAIGTVWLTAKKLALAAATGVATAAQWALNVAMYANPAYILVAKIMLIVAAVAAFAYGVYRLVQHLGGFREVVRKIGEAFRSFGGWLGSFFAGLKLFTVRIGEAIVFAAKAVAGFFAGLASRMAGFFRRVWDDLVKAIRAVLSYTHVLGNRWARIVLSAIQLAFGWIPWLGGKIEGMMRDFDPLQLMIQTMRKSNKALAREVEVIANIIRDSKPELYGPELMDEFIRSFQKAKPELWEEVQKFIEPIRLQLEAKSPPKKGPLRDINKWGEKVGDEYIAGFARSTARLLRVLPSDIQVPVVHVPSVVSDAVSSFENRQLPTAIGKTADALATHPHSPARFDIPSLSLDGMSLTSIADVFARMPVPRLEPISEVVRETTEHNNTIREVAERSETIRETSIVAPPLTVPVSALPGATPVAPLAHALPLPEVTRSRVAPVPASRPPIRVDFSVHVGGVTVNASRDMSRAEARALGETAGTGISEKLKADVSKYLLEVLSAGEAILMPDEME